MVSPAHSSGLEILAGCYDDRAGLVLLHLEADGRCDIVRSLPGTRNVSYATWSARHRKLYAVREDDEGAIDVLAPDDDWEIARTISTEGARPCHCALDKTERYLAVANYASGGVSVFSLDGDGLPQPSPWTFAGEGSGPVAGRQDGPHAHWVGFAPEQRALLVADLGADRIRVFAFDAERGMHGEEGVALAAPRGSGPRWLHFGLASADVVLVSELSSTLSLHSWVDREMYQWDCCSSRAPGAAGENVAGHIVANRAGDRVHVTNRGDETVCLFAIDRGHLRFRGSVGTGGESPRYLYLADELGLLLVGHEKTGPLTVLEISNDRMRPVAHLDIDRVAWISRRPDTAPCGSM